MSPQREIQCTECGGTATVPAAAISNWRSGSSQQAIDLQVYVIEQNIRCANDGAQSWRLTHL